MLRISLLRSSTRTPIPSENDSKNKMLLSKLFTFFKCQRIKNLYKSLKMRYIRLRSVKVYRAVSDESLISNKIGEGNHNSAYNLVYV